jgi:hypothetical protein
VLEGDLTPEEGKDVVGMIEGISRITAVRTLSEMRQQQLENFKLMGARTVGGGLMVVPLAASLDDWEATAGEMQAELKQTVRE